MGLSLSRALKETHSSFSSALLSSSHGRGTALSGWLVSVPLNHLQASGAPLMFLSTTSKHEPRASPG